MEQVGGQWLHSQYYLRLGLWWVEGLPNRIVLAKQGAAGLDVVNAAVDAAELLERLVAAAVDVELKNDDDHPDLVGGCYDTGLQSIDGKTVPLQDVE